MLISLPVQNGRHFKNSYFSHLTDFSAMAPYPIFFRALKTIIMPNFMLLTESEQFKHISALLFRELYITALLKVSSKCVSLNATLN